MASTTLAVIRSGFKMLLETGRFDRVLEKVNITSAESGKLTAELIVSPEHTNRGGSLHGGFTATLVDQMSTMALLTFQDKEQVLVTGVSVELNVTFISAANVGDKLTINASTLKKGRNLAFLTVDILKDSKLVARGSHVKYIGQPKL